MREVQDGMILGFRSVNNRPGNGLRHRGGIQETKDNNYMSVNGGDRMRARLGHEHNRSCIVLVTRNALLPGTTMDDVLTITENLGCRLVAVFVNTMPLLRDRQRFRNDVKQSVSEFSAKAEARRLPFSSIEDSGKISSVVRRLCHTLRRLDFVVIDQSVAKEMVESAASVPVFSIQSYSSMDNDRAYGAKQFFQGESAMAAKQRKRHVMKTVTFGALTLALYAAVFSMSDTVLHLWAKGGVYALLPVATVFVFSYAHGSFTSNFWSALGIEGSKASARKQSEKRATAAEPSRPRRDTRPRLRAE